MRIRREPALAAVGVLAPAVQLTTAFLIHDAPLQASINAASALLAGLLVAALVDTDRLAPALTGFAQGLLALGLQLGWHLSAEQQASVMVLVGVLAAAFLRTQLTPSVPATSPPDPTPIRRITPKGTIT